jgi:pyrimidine-nucleoside phosphorylase
MRAVDIIRKKRDAEALSLSEIEAFIRGAVAAHDGPERWPQYQVSALLMAIFLRGMTAQETADLTAAMVRSGEKLDLSEIPGPKVDKHSTGGVGDKTSLILAPLAAACGVVVPMMSGRGLGHSGGTLDKLEAIPGFRVNLSLAAFRSALREVGCALIGQTAEIAPADRILYALRDVTATVASIPLISSSIMSKKIAEGIEALVLDVKCGRGAFMRTRDEASCLAQTLVRIGQSNGVRTQAVLTAMDHPLGRAIGNAPEVAESIRTLRGEGPKDLSELSVHLAARMVCLGKLTSTLEEAEAQVRNALTSGRGLEKFRQIIEHQGGDPMVVDDLTRLPGATHREILRAERSGYLADIDAEKVGRATMLLGAGRARAEEVVDPAVGVVLLAGIGEEVRAGDGLVEMQYNDPSRRELTRELLASALLVNDAPPLATDLFLETLE